MKRSKNGSRWCRVLLTGSRNKHVALSVSKPWAGIRTKKRQLTPPKAQQIRKNKKASKSSMILSNSRRGRIRFENL